LLELENAAAPARTVVFGFFIALALPADRQTRNLLAANIVYP